MENKPICEIDEYGIKRWKLNGVLHREDGPAIEFGDGSKFWFIDNKRHCEDGPAVEYSDGEKQWYLNDKLHRLDGPAVEYSDGTKLWWINGNHIDKEITKWANENDIDLGNLSVDDKLLIKLTWADYGK